MDFNNLESLLRAGVSEDAIAKAFTKQLNEAIEAARKPTPFQEACMKLTEAWNEALDKCGLDVPEVLYLEPSKELMDTLLGVVRTAIQLEDVAKDPNFHQLVDELLSKEE